MLGHGRAGSAGAVTVGGVPVRGGEVVTLVNAAGRRLTSLHVAHLRVDPDRRPDRGGVGELRGR